MYRNIILAAGLVLLVGGTAYAVDPENTEKNVRDKDGKSLTVFDQGGSEADRNITASIRKSIVDDDKLSMNAHNVKIITINGVVTLRGPVDSPAEKTTVEARAKSAGGVKHVDNQLEVNHD